MTRWIAWIALGTALIGAQAWADEEPAQKPIVLFDFEQGEPADDWTFRNMAVAEIRVPEGKTPSAGRALSIRAARPRSIVHRAVDVHDWRTARAFSMFVKVDADGPVAMRLLAFRGKGPAARIKRFTLQPGDWRELVLPLKDWREDLKDQVCDFSQIDRLAIRWDGGKGSVSIDDLRLLPGTRGRKSCLPSPQDTAKLLFPEADDVRILESRSIVVITTAPVGDGKAAAELLKRLASARAQLQLHFRVGGDPERHATLFVARNESDFGAAFVRLTKHYGVNLSPAPRGSSRCILGVGGSWFHTGYGWNRPVFTSAAANAFLHEALRIAPNGNWVTAGLSTAVQVRLHPAALSRSEVLEAFRQLASGDEGGWFRPLGVVFRTKTVRTNAHAQAMTVMEFLAESHADRLPAIWDALRATRKPVGPLAVGIMAKAVGLTPEAFERAWITWGLKHYAK